MTDTTIAVSDDVKKRIREMKSEGETFNGTLLRLAKAYESEGKKWTESEIEDIVDRRIETLRR
jgi:predicted CopG family antitoxin